MPIEEGKDRHGSFIIVKGTVDGVYYNELKVKQSYAKGWTPTHGLKIVVDGNPISLGLVDKEDKPQLRAKDAGGTWVDVHRGAVVEIDVEEEESYQGKRQFSAKTGAIKVITAVEKPVPAAKPYASKHQDSGFSTGMAICHANNGATALVNDFNYDAVKAGTMIHDATTEVKEFLAQDSSLSKKDVGNQAGNAVNNAAARLAAYGKTPTDLVSVAKKILEDNKALRKYIEPGDEPVSEASEEAHQFPPDFEDEVPF